MKFSEAIGKVTNTDNGAIAFTTTGDPLVDAMFLYGNIHAKSKKVASLYEKIVEKYGKETADAMIMLMRDARNGMGVRQNTREAIKALVDKGYDVRNIINALPEIGRWDDVVWLWDRFNEFDDKEFEYYKQTFMMIANQIVEDGENLKKEKSISLLAKWLPSPNASSKETKRKARKLYKAFDMKEKTYRKMLSAFREYIDVVERKASANKWNEIDYSKVPSLAMQKYFNAFLEHDQERFMQYLDDVKNGKKKINTGVMPIHMLVANRRMLGKELFDKIWRDIESPFVSDDILPIVDVSYSMVSVKIFGGNLRDMSVGIGVLASERIKGEFKDKVVIFSSKPRFIDLSDIESPFDKIEKVMNDSDCSNTNFVGVFEQILEIATTIGVKDEDMPKRILLISDMQFDSVNSEYWGRSKLPIDAVKDMYKEAGYTMPEMIYWNMHGELKSPEMRDGIIAMSGFQPKMLEFLGCKTPEEISEKVVKKYEKYLKIVE